MEGMEIGALSALLEEYGIMSLVAFGLLWLYRHERGVVKGLNEEIDAATVARRGMHKQINDLTIRLDRCEQSREVVAAVLRRLSPKDAELLDAAFAGD